MLSRLRGILPATMKRRLTDHDVWFRTKAHLLTRPFYSGLGSILMFHRVCPRGGGPRLGFNKLLEVTPELLEETVLFFRKKKYAFVSLDEVYEILRAGKRKGKFVAFTIDDGYADNYTHAYSILKGYGVPFTIYVTTCFPDGKAVLWWYLLEELLLQRDGVEIQSEGETIEFDCSTQAKKEAAFNAIQCKFTYSSDEEFGREINNLFGAPSADIHKHVKELSMTWGQIEQLSKDPLVTIGAHTVDHFALSGLSSLEAARQALESKQKIESYIGKEVRHFAYPYGGRAAAGDRDARIIKECGFRTATTTRSGNIFSAHKDFMECLPRLAVTGADLEKGVDYLNLWVDGLVPCHENGLRRVVTL